MQCTLHPYASAGVVLAGASLIAITPAVGLATNSQFHDVRLVSTGSPLDLTDLATLAGNQEYPIVTPEGLLTDTISNLENLNTQIAADPSPILDQILINQAAYANDLATASQNAGNDLMSAIQGLPDVLQQASADFASGDVYDAVFSPWSYLLSSALEVSNDLQTGTSEVVQGIAANIENVVNDTGGGGFANGLTANATPIWLTLLERAPLFGPNAADAAFAGVSQDIVTAANNGDYSTVLSDLANAPSTITDAFLNGYQITPPVVTPPPPVAEITGITNPAGLPPEYGFLTDFSRGFGGGGGGTIENILQAERDIAADLGGTAGARVVADGPTADLLTGAGASTDFSALIGDLTSALNPSTLLGDLTGLFDPSAISDLGAQLTADLGPDLSSVLLSLF